jgi:hypothetical protein
VREEHDSGEEYVSGNEDQSVDSGENFGTPHSSSPEEAQPGATSSSAPLKSPVAHFPKQIVPKNIAPFATRLRSYTKKRNLADIATPGRAEPGPKRKRPQKPESLNVQPPTIAESLNESSGSDSRPSQQRKTKWLTRALKPKSTEEPDEDQQQRPGFTGWRNETSPGIESGDDDNIADTDDETDNPRRRPTRRAKLDAIERNAAVYKDGRRQRK